MLLCLAVLLMAPMPQVKVAFGAVLVVLALVYTVIDRSLERGELHTPSILRREGKTHKRRPIASADEIEKRIKQMRRAYKRGGRSARGFQKALDKVAEPCRPYYTRMMQVEASILTLLNTGPVRGLNPKGTLKQVRALMQQIAVLVEQLQLADRLAGFYEAGSDEAIMVMRARERLIRRADRAMMVLEGVPARLLHLTTATSNRGMAPLVEDLRRMTERLEGKADAYEAMSAQEDLETLYSRLEMEP